jgi:lipopolysaccharide export system protein LptA
MPRLIASALLVAGALCAGAAYGRSSDRNKPMDVEAGSTDCSVDASGPCTFSGSVHITQGTLDIRAAHADVRRGGGDIRSVKLTGSPVLMKQQMDDGAMMNARAARIDYDLPADTIVLSGDAFVEQPGESSIRSERIVYNMRTGQVQSGGEGNGRVKLRLMPKNARSSDDAPARPAGNG